MKLIRWHSLSVIYLYHFWKLQYDLDFMGIKRIYIKASGMGLPNNKASVNNSNMTNLYRTTSVLCCSKSNILSCFAPTLSSNALIANMKTWTEIKIADAPAIKLVTKSTILMSLWAKGFSCSLGYFAKSCVYSDIYLFIQ